jgi:dTDP-4-amino-4,6-dideoxygalactose transaminase
MNMYMMKWANFRMPNLNAALACAQLEQLDFFLEHKKFSKRVSIFFCQMVYRTETLIQN